ncbi:MAG: hypothetical protein KME19_21555 [Microcoleus vaginatus WJT46-NPBG5]|jgi:hypothetical protein|nr:hypothetical protein [Microcoleus vaginatus WJT46-NPBG5]
MSKFIVQVRTRNNLLELLAKEESQAWVIAEDKVQQITDVQIVNFDGTQMIEGIFDRSASWRREDNRLVLKFQQGQIVNCQVKFDGQNPVRSLEE